VTALKAQLAAEQKAKEEKITIMLKGPRPKGMKKFKMVVEEEP